MEDRNNDKAPRWPATCKECGCRFDATKCPSCQAVDVPEQLKRFGEIVKPEKP